MKYTHSILFYNGGTTKPMFVEFDSNDLVPKKSNVTDAIESCVKSQNMNVHHPVVVSITTMLNK